jgi:AAA+ ATPase superfamily predicted ATPase
MFVNREQELAFLDELLKRTRPTAAQLVLLYGRRRVGKTVLARHWAEHTGLPTIYWAAEREPAGLQRRKFYGQLTGLPFTQAPALESWADLWTVLAAQVADRRQILILDEIPYASEADPAFLSALQHAWDQRFKTNQLAILLSGSHVHTMETFLQQGSPLFGRFTGQWHLQPLAYRTLRAFFPRWPAEQRVSAYAILGGVPAYLERLDPERSLSANLRDVILAPGGMFTAEPDFLLYDELREPRNYRAVLQAIGAGAHSLDEISNLALIGKTHLTQYLARLQELRLVERRLPVTVPPARRLKSRMGRYHLVDPFMRFFFRFIAPQQGGLGYKPEQALAAVEHQIRAFVGRTAFEELAREWVESAGAAGQLPFTPQAVGQHWSRSVEADVVAVNWQQRALLLGECKWIAEPMARDVVRGLIELKAIQVLKTLPDAGQGWQVHYAFFSRAGWTPAARDLALAHHSLLVDLKRLDQDLSAG